MAEAFLGFFLVPIRHSEEGRPCWVFLNHRLSDKIFPKQQSDKGLLRSGQRTMSSSQCRETLPPLCQPPCQQGHAGGWRGLPGPPSQDIRPSFLPQAAKGWGWGAHVRPWGQHPGMPLRERGTSFVGTSQDPEGTWSHLVYSVPAGQAPVTRVAWALRAPDSLP